LTLIFVAILAVSGDFFEDLLLEETIDLSFAQTIGLVYEPFTVAIALSMNFDAVADSYDEVRAIPNWVLEKFYEKILEKRTRFDRNSVVLDAGIGSGRTVDPLLALGVQVVGVDISRRMLAKAAEKVKKRSAKSRVNLVRGDVAHLPFRAQSFDMVISIHVLWLVRKWKNAIFEARRVLRSEGFFVTADHTSPEFVFSGIGAKCWELEDNAFGYKGFLRNQYISRVAPIKRVFIPQMKRFSLRVLQTLRNYHGWQSYLAKKSKSQETYAIVRKSALSISTAAALLERRASSLRSILPNKTIEKFRVDVAKWTDEESEMTSVLEMKEYFKFTVTQFQ
jgi:ubiquinone/menaquinone biosynthesis C-methylase UbiE